MNRCAEIAKVFLALAIVILFSGCTLKYTATQDITNNEIIWEEKVPESIQSFSTSHEWKTCVVYTHQSDKGITLKSINPVEKHVTQIISIIFVKKDVISFRIGFFGKPTKDGFIPLLNREGRDDIFASQCANAAHRLPPEVKKLFFGYYGLGKAPE